MEWEFSSSLRSQHNNSMRSKWVNQQFCDEWKRRLRHRRSHRQIYTNTNRKEKERKGKPTWESPGTMTAFHYVHDSHIFPLWSWFCLSDLIEECSNSTIQCFSAYFYWLASIYGCRSCTAAAFHPQAKHTNNNTLRTQYCLCRAMWWAVAVPVCRRLLQPHHNHATKNSCGLFGCRPFET